MAKVKRPRHPNKEIEAAVRYGEERGWSLTKSSGRAHAWGIMRCPLGRRGGCGFSVPSTPREPEVVAKRIIHRVDRCHH